VEGGGLYRWRSTSSGGCRTHLPKTPPGLSKRGKSEKHKERPGING